MQLLGLGRPRPVVVKSYGRDSLLALANPVLTLIVRTFGLQVRVKSDEQVEREMEQGAREMFAKGYRIARSEQFEIQPFGATWFRVTYELVDREGDAAHDGRR